MSTTFELLECAEINFENCARMIPDLGMHPIFMLAQAQLAGAIKALENDKGLHKECDFDLEGTK